MPYLNRSTLAYPATGAFPAGTWEDTRDPTSNDFKSFSPGVIWINFPSHRGWIMVDKTSTSGTWIQMATSGTGILDITGNSGGMVGPDGSNNINLLGSGTLTVTGVPGTHTLTISQNGTVATTYAEDSGSATPSGGTLNIVGGTGVSTSGAGSTVTINAMSAVPLSFVEDSGSAVPSSNVLKVLGGAGVFTSGAGNTITITAATDVATQYTENSGTAVPSSNNLNILGASGITTSGAGSTVTISPGGTIATTYTENSGSAAPSGNNLNILGASGITTAGAGSTVTISPGSTIATTYTEDTGTAAPSGNNLNIKGGTGIATSGAGSTVTIATTSAVATSYAEDSGTATPSSNVLNVIGGTGISMLGAGSTITITNTSASATSFHEDSGTATPLAGVLNVMGGTNIATTGAGNTVTVAFSPPTTQTWTPVLNFGGTTTGITYVALGGQLGYYQRIGNIVFFWFAITLTSKGSATGPATITGLPFTAQSTPVGASVAQNILETTHITYNAGFTYCGTQVVDATTTLDLQQFGTGQIYTFLTDTNFVNSCGVTSSGFYFTS